MWFGGHDVDFHRVDELAALVVERRFQVTMPRCPWREGDVLPDQIPFDDWVDLLNSCLETVKRTSRMPQEVYPKTSRMPQKMGNEYAAKVRLRRKVSSWLVTRGPWIDPITELIRPSPRGA